MRYLDGIKSRCWGTKKRKIFTSLVLLLVVGIVSLEILSRVCPRLEADGPDCYELLGDLIHEGEGAVLEQPSGELDSVIAERIIYVEREKIAGANGVACWSYGFVADDLPEHAKRYVAAHEAIHLLGEDNETVTNYRAALKEPLGFIQTIFWSLGYGLMHVSWRDFPCAFGRLWSIFKEYFLNMA